MALRQILLKNRGVGLVIHYRADTISKKFKRLMKGVGIDLKDQAVHILTKSAASHWLEECTKFAVKKMRGSI